MGARGHIYTEKDSEQATNLASGTKPLDLMLPTDTHFWIVTRVLTQISLVQENCCGSCCHFLHL